MSTTPHMPAMGPDLGALGFDTSGFGTSIFGAMPGIRLVVDYGTTTIRALLCWPDGQRRPLVTDSGDARWPSAVAAAPGGRAGGLIDGLVAGPEAIAAADTRANTSAGSRGDTSHDEPDDKLGVCRDLKSHLLREQISIGDRTVEPATALAAVLARLSVQAHRLAGLPVGELVVTVPAAWGPQHRRVVRDAAHRANLPAPLLVAVPAAVGWHLTATGAAVPPGSMLLVCDAGHAAFEATLLMRASTGVSTGFATLATARVTDAGGAALERRLAEHCLTQLSTVDTDLADRLRQPQSAADRRDRLVFDQQLQAARHALATTAPAAVIAVPAPHAPIVISRDHYDELAVPLARQCADTTRDVLEAAGIEATHLGHVVCVGGSTTTATLDALREQGLAARPAAQPEWAAVLGAADTPTTNPTPPSAPTRSPSARRWRPLPLLSAVVAGGCAIALAGHALYTSTTGGYYHNIPQINWGEYAMATCCALLATTAATDVPTRPLSLPRRAPRGPQAGLAPAGLAPAGLGPAGLGQTGLFQAPLLAYAVLVGLLAALGVALAGVIDLALPWSLGTYFAWAVLPILPLAGLATTVGLLTHPHRSLGQPFQSQPAQHVEPARRRPAVPAEGIATAALGMIGLQISLTGAEHPLVWNTLLTLWGADTAGTLYTLSGRLGAVALAIGTALTAATALRSRLIAVPAAAITAAVITPFDLATAFGLAFVAAATFWWAQRTLHLLTALAPRWRTPAATMDPGRSLQPAHLPPAHLQPSFHDPWSPAPTPTNTPANTPMSIHGVIGGLGRR